MTKTVKLPWMDVEVKPEAGRQIRVDGWQTRCASILQDCELPEFASFRLPSFNFFDIAYACEVEITGRVAQRQPYSDCHWVRVKITWVQDGEPNTVSYGWMVV